MSLEVDDLVHFQEERTDDLHSQAVYVAESEAVSAAESQTVSVVENQAASAAVNP